jgi:hypothetical protein
MEAYFKFKFIMELVIPVVLVSCFALLGIYYFLNQQAKIKLMERRGYTYKKSLGRNVALEYQSHWVNGEVRINWRKVDSLSYKLSYKELKKYIERQETK